MDAEPGSARQQHADERLDGRLRERTEALRRERKDWREVAEIISAEARLYVAKSTLHRWADEGGWDVTPAPVTEQAS